MPGKAVFAFGVSYLNGYYPGQVHNIIIKVICELQIILIHTTMGGQSVNPNKTHNQVDNLSLPVIYNRLRRLLKYSNEARYCSETPQR